MWREIYATLFLCSLPVLALPIVVFPRLRDRCPKAVAAVFIYASFGGGPIFCLIASGAPHRWQQTFIVVPILSLVVILALVASMVLDLGHQRLQRDSDFIRKRLG